MKTPSATAKSTKLNSYLVSSSVLTTLAASSQGAIVLFSGSGSFNEGPNAPDAAGENNFAAHPDGFGRDQAQITIALPDGTNLFLDPAPGAYNLGSELFLGLTPGGSWAGTGGFTGKYTYSTTEFLSSGTFINGHTYIGPGISEIALLTTGYFGAHFAPGIAGFHDGYFGFQTSTNRRGWLKATYDSATGLFTYNGGAMEMVVGAPLAAGAVPEPNAALLALAGIGGAVLRRRRKQAA